MSLFGPENGRLVPISEEANIIAEIEYKRGLERERQGKSQLEQSASKKSIRQNIRDLFYRAANRLLGDQWFDLS